MREMAKVAIGLLNLILVVTLVGCAENSGVQETRMALLSPGCGQVTPQGKNLFAYNDGTEMFLVLPSENILRLRNVRSGGIVVFEGGRVTYVCGDAESRSELLKKLKEERAKSANAEIRRFDF